MKKPFAILASLALVASLLAGCGEKAVDSPGPGESDQTGQTPSASGPQSAIDAYPDRDLGGYEYVIRTFDAAPFVPADDGTPLAAARLERNKIVEEKFNCKIVVQEGNYGTHFNDAQPAILAGEKWGDIIAPTMWMDSYFLTAGFLLDLNTVPTLTPSADYYSQQMVKTSTINAKTYELIGDLNPAVNLTWCVYFNKRLITELNLDSPYELVRANEWTWDKFNEMAIAATKDLNGDGVMDQNDRYGYTGARGDLHIATFASSGIPFFAEENGRMELVVNTPKTFDVINKVKITLTEGQYFFPKTPGGEFSEYFNRGFIPGKVLFFAYLPNNVDLLLDMEDDWGMVPMPKYDPAQETYSGWVDHNAAVVSMLTANPDPATSGLITDALYAVSKEMVTPAYFSQFANLYFRDDDAADMLELINAGPYYDVAFLARSAKGEIGWPVEWVNRALDGNDFASQYESQATAVSEALDTLFNH